MYAITSLNFSSRNPQQCSTDFYKCLGYFAVDKRFNCSYFTFVTYVNLMVVWLQLWLYLMLGLSFTLCKKHKMGWSSISFKRHYISVPGASSPEVSYTFMHQLFVLVNTSAEFYTTVNSLVIHHRVLQVNPSNWNWDTTFSPCCVL